MPTEDVVVLADGEPHPYIKTVDISLSAEKNARSATLGTAEPDGRFWLPPGLPITIMVSGKPVLTGFVRDYAPDVSKPMREVGVQVESKTCDLAEGSVIHKTGRVEKKSLVEAGQEFGKGFSARIRAEGSFDAIPEVVVDPGESVFALLERYARSQGAYITDDEHGDQVLFKGIRGRHAGVLELPGNVTKATANLTERSKRSETRVRGQTARGKGKAAFRSEAVIKDPAVKRYRPLLVIHEGDADAQRLKERASYDQDRASGFAATATVHLNRWRDDGGTIWTPGFVIPLDAWDKLRVAQDMAVASGRLTWNKDDGTRAVLQLRDPKSFAAKGGKNSGGKADSAWAVPDEDAEVEVEE